MENTSVTLPEELIIEILLRMPLKSLVKCTSASKQIASLIRDKQFRDRYLVRSMEMPRLLFIDHELHERDFLFHSVYQAEPLLSSGQQQMRISLDLQCIISPIRGLICLQEQTKVSICNLGARKFRILPKIQARKEAAIATFFGYDEDVFKVLSMTNSKFDEYEESKEHQVFIVGSGEESWRPISCKQHHSPVTQGLCKEGVLYYVARSGREKYMVMSFNVRSEEFTVIELPVGVNIGKLLRKLVNYNGNIALVDYDGLDFGVVIELNGNGFFKIWVRDEGKGTWSRKDIKIPRWKETVGDMKLYFKGTIGTGKLVFATSFVDTGSFFVLYYDHTVEGGNLNLVNIEGVAPKLRGDLQKVSTTFKVQTFLDHVDSPWLI